MRQIGTVEKLNNDLAIVSIRRATACGEKCGSCKGSCVPTKQQVIAINQVGAAVGDKVAMDMSDSNVLQAAAFVYLLPLALMIVGYLVAYFYLQSELKSMFFAFIVLVFSFIPVKLADNRAKKVGKYQITITKVLR